MDNEQKAFVGGGNDSQKDVGIGNENVYLMTRISEFRDFACQQICTLPEEIFLDFCSIT